MERGRRWGSNYFAQMKKGRWKGIPSTGLCFPRNRLEDDADGRLGAAGGGAVRRSLRLERCAVECVRRQGDGPVSLTNRRELLGCARHATGQDEVVKHVEGFKAELYLHALIHLHDAGDAGIGLVNGGDVEERDRL